MTSTTQNDHDTTPDSLLVSAVSLAKLLQVSTRTLWRLRSSGRLPKPVQVGGSLRWRTREVQDWIDAGCPRLDEWESTSNS